MNRRALRGFTKAEVLAIAFFAVLIVAMIFGRETRSEYCQICGKKRASSGITVFLQPVLWTRTEKPSEFSKLYAEFVSAKCTHLWRRSSRGQVGLLVQGIACDTRSRYIFDYPQRLRLVRRLKSKNRIKTIIANCDVRASAWPGEKDPNSEGGEAFRAFDELVDVKTQQQEDAWWRKHRHLFEKK